MPADAPRAGGAVYRVRGRRLSMKGVPMAKNGVAALVGLLMIVGGLVMFLVLRDVQTPVIGLRQAGLVIAVLGVFEVGAVWWSRFSSGTKKDE